MEKLNIKSLTIVLIVLIMAIAFPFSASAAESDVSADTKDPAAAGEDAILSFYEQNKDMAASLGIAMIDKGDTELYYLGDIEKNPDFVFDWGSCTKVLTWVSVMQLVEQERIDLDADIRTYLPGGFLTRLKYDEPITMLNLMNHNAGFQEMDCDLFAEDKSKIPPLDEALKDNQPPQIRRPGEIVAYSNFGAALAGYIVERVSGQDYEDSVISLIFEPLGMEHTSIRPDHSDNQWVEDRWLQEKCYWVSEDGEKTELGTGKFPRNPLVYGIFGPAGSACGTIEDFSKFVKALIPYENNKSLLFEKDSTLADMYEPSLYYADGTARNAHGMWAEQFGNGLFGHGGNSDGFSSNFVIDPIAQKAYAVMTNIIGEGVFCRKSLPIIFGEYDWGDKDFVACEDISGRYNSMRAYFQHSLHKFDNIRNTLLVEKTGQDGVYNLSFKGEVFSKLRQVSDRVFKDDIGMRWFAGDGGVLQFGIEDNRKVDDTAYYAQWALTILGLSLCFLAAALFLTKLSMIIVKKIRKKRIISASKEKYHLLSLGCISVALLFILILLFVDVEGTVFGWIVSLCAVAAFVFSILQVKVTDAKLRTKLLRIATLTASVALLANVIFWELYIP